MLEGIIFLTSKTSPSLSSSSSDSSPELQFGGNDVSGSASKDSTVAQACHVAAWLVIACALCVILAALRRHISSPVTRPIEHNCRRNCYEHILR